MDWRLIEKGKKTLWSLKDLVCTHEQYVELLILRDYLLKLTPNTAPYFRELNEVCLKLELSNLERFIAYHTYSEMCSKLPLCSMFKELDISPKLIWIEHYICLYEQHHSLLKI